MAKFNNMSVDEVIATFTRDYPKLFYWSEKTAHSLSPYSHTIVSWRNKDGLEYLIYVDRKGRGMSCSYWALSGMNGRLCAYNFAGMPPYEIKADYFTHHFIRRFAERTMKKPNVSDLEALSEIIYRMPSYIKLWEDKDSDECMVAFMTGIGFGYQDREKHHVKFTTYVSDDMFFAEQREAYEMSRDIRNTYAEFASGEYGTYGSPLFDTMIDKIDSVCEKLYPKFAELIQRYKDRQEDGDD